MNTLPDFELYCRQDVIEFKPRFLEKLEASGIQALGEVIRLPKAEEHVLCDLDLVEVTLIDDQTIAQVHDQFMDIEGATDVITFHHGEILISVETALVQAKAYDEPFERELFRYLVHGLLHLQGHTDAEAPKRAAMHEIQEGLVLKLWS